MQIIYTYSTFIYESFKVISTQCHINNSGFVLSEMKKKESTSVLETPYLALRAGPLLGSYPGPLYSWPYKSIPFLSLKKELNTLASFGGQTLIAPRGQSTRLAFLDTLVSSLSPTATQRMMTLRA